MTRMYCPACEVERDFRSEDRPETYNVRGEQITLAVTVDVCRHCSETRFDEQRDGALLLRAYTEYRSRRGLLQPEEIRRIRKMYGLSQQAFAKLLGMSEATINRYESGSLQEDTHDNIIRMASRPENIRELLERRGHLLTPHQRAQVIASWLEEDLPPVFCGSEWAELYGRYVSAYLEACRHSQRPTSPTLCVAIYVADVAASVSWGRPITGRHCLQAPLHDALQVHVYCETRMRREGLIEDENPRGDERQARLIRCTPAAGTVVSVLSQREDRLLTRAVRAIDCSTIGGIMVTEDPSKSVPPASLRRVLVEVLSGFDQDRED